MMDKVERLGSGTIIQHGPQNDRIYLMKLRKDEVEWVIGELNSLAQKHKYGKIFCKVPLSCVPLFLLNGYFQEAQIPRFYQGEEDVAFMSKFRDSDRIMGLPKDDMENLHQLLAVLPEKTKLPSSAYTFRQLTQKDAVSMCDLFKQTFESYPFPVFDPEYVGKTMDEGVVYFGAEINNQLVAVASSEVDSACLNAEMTDFATHVDHRGKQLASHLLVMMEEVMKSMGIKTLYTIARLSSMPMNKTFLRQGYRYTGTLIKNTQIAGKIESMNVLYKSL